jgi:RNA polymerase-binding protein DksA
MAAARKTTKKKTTARKTTSKKKSGASAKKTTKTKKTTTKSKSNAAAKKKTTKAKTVKKTTKTRAIKTKAATEKAPAAAKSKSAPAKPRAKKKPAFDPEFLNEVRESLIDERAQLLSMLQSTQAQLAGRETGLADLSDIASGGFEDELALGLMASEAATLEKIDAAIKRLNDGSYGICVDCENAIPKKRLEFLPFALRCMECEGTRERRVRMGTLDA